MKIISIRKGFQTDHSSTSYEFLAIDKILDSSQREDVANLSSRARPTKRRVSFIYHGDCNDLPGGWRPLIKKYYDVMYTESYDWWTLAMAFEADQKIINEIEKYECCDENDLGMSVDSEKNRVIISIHCCLSPDIYYRDSYSEYDQDEEDEEMEIESNDSLLNLLSKNREYLIKRDYRLLYGVWEKFSIKPENNDEIESPPKPPKMDKLPQPITYLLSGLKKIE